MSEKNLPLKLVLHRENDYVKNIGGGKNKFFCEVNQELQTKIINEFDGLLDYYADVFEESELIPAVGKIVVKNEAVAKSHKPNSLCRECEIIGSGSLGEIFIKVTKSSIEKTKELVSKLPSKEFEANMTTIEKIVPIYSEDKISDSLYFIEKNSRFDEIKKDIKIKLFDFNDDLYDSQIMHYVLSKLSDLGLSETSEVITYGNRIKYLKVEASSFNDVIEISKINGVKSVDFFPNYSLSINNEYNVGDDFILPSIEEVESEIIVGIIDSGISEENENLNKYVISREEYVPKKYQNRSHGTFVASTIQYGNILNGIETSNNRRFKFVDIVAIPNSDKEYGDTDTLNEIDLMSIIEESMKKYSGYVKIWNLSLGTSKICTDSMSDLAIFFDYIQDEYGVQFIVACGNYDELPQRTWPPTNDLGESDRVTSPADSVRSISVGSLAYYESENSIVKSNQPSSFSRRGPGANFIVKPDVVDYGGNWCLNGDSNVYMKGLDESGRITSNIGTSFSAPRISQKIASVYEDMIEKDLFLAKALIIHSARLNAKELIDDNDLKNYYGFGMPSVDSSDILNCSKNEVTLIFKQKIKKGSHLEMIDFPFPKSLVENGKYKGEICMTLLYAPPLDDNFGQEYCRTNIDVSFGTYNYDEEGKPVFKGQVPLEATWDEKFESYRVEHGFKWCPVKSYYRNLKRGIQVSDGWKIRVDMYERNEANVPEQEFALLVTVKDSKDRDIYSDIVTMLNEKGYITEDLKTRYNVRQRAQA